MGLESLSLPCMTLYPWSPRLAILPTPKTDGEKEKRGKAARARCTKPSGRRRIVTAFRG